MDRIKKEWARYVDQKRTSLHLTNRELARLGRMDASYITLIQRDGYIPSPHVILRLAAALNADPDEMLHMAGYRGMKERVGT